jgi:hypothetical protein
LAAGNLRTRAAPAEAVARLEQAQSQHLAVLASLERNRGAVSRLRTALGTEAGRFASLSRAAKFDQRATYATARMSVMQAGRELAAAAAELAREGFTLPALPALALAGLPKPPPTITPAPPPSAPAPAYVPPVTPGPSAPAPTPTSVPRAVPPKPSAPQFGPATKQTL